MADANGDRDNAERAGIGEALKQELSEEAKNTNKMADTLRRGGSTVTITGTPAAIAARKAGVVVTEKEN